MSLLRNIFIEVPEENEASTTAASGHAVWQAGSEVDGPSSPHYPAYPTFHTVINFCNQFIIPVMIITGLVGNTLTFLVFVLSPLRRNSTSVYLAALAMTDAGFLFSLGAGWLDNLRLYFFHQEPVCTIFVYVTYMLSFLSVWFVVCFTTEMYLMLFHEKLADRVSQPPKARAVVLALTGVSALIYLYTFWTTKQITGQEGKQTCGFVSDVKVRMGLSILDTVLTLVLPFSLLIFMNTRILVVIVGFSRKSEESKIDMNMELTSITCKDTQNVTLLEDHDHPSPDRSQARGQGEGEGHSNRKGSQRRPGRKDQEQGEGRDNAADEGQGRPQGEGKNQQGQGQNRRASERQRQTTENSITRCSTPEESQQQKQKRSKRGRNTTTGRLQRNGGRRRQINKTSEETGESEEFYFSDENCEDDVDCAQERKRKVTGKVSKMHSMQRKSFKMLVTVAIVFLILNLPSHAVRLQGLVRSIFTPNYVTSELEHLCQQLFQIFFYFNFVANFIIYNACAKSFRTAFLTLPFVCSKYCASCNCPWKSKKPICKTSGRVAQELRRMREEQNSRLVEVNLDELHISRMDSFGPDFRYQSPPCLLRHSSELDGHKAEKHSRSSVSR